MTGRKPYRKTKGYKRGYTHKPRQVVTWDKDIHEKINDFASKADMSFSASANMIVRLWFEDLEKDKTNE